MALAFQAVFGQEGKGARTSDQRLVMEHLCKACGFRQPRFQRSDGYNAYAAAQRDGASAVIIAIEQQLERARATVEADKPKPKSRR